MALVSLSSEFTNSMLLDSRDMYMRNLNTIGMNSEYTIGSGLNYVRALQILYHCIEAKQWLVTKSANCVKFLFYPITNSFTGFAIRKHEEICVVQGTIVEPRNIEDEVIILPFVIDDN